MRRAAWAVAATAIPEADKVNLLDAIRQSRRQHQLRAKIRFQLRENLDAHQPENATAITGEDFIRALTLSLIVPSLFTLAKRFNETTISLHFHQCEPATRKARPGESVDRRTAEYTQLPMRHALATPCD